MRVELEAFGILRGYMDISGPLPEDDTIHIFKQREQLDLNMADRLLITYPKAMKFRYNGRWNTCKMPIFELVEEKTDE